MPASLRSPTSTSLGHLRRTSSSANGPSAPATATPASNGNQPHEPAATSLGRSSTEKVSPERAGAAQIRSSRPRPAVCDSATSTVPDSAPARADAASSALVDATESSDADRRPGARVPEQSALQIAFTQGRSVQIGEAAGHQHYATWT